MKWCHNSFFQFFCYFFVIFYYEPGKDEMKWYFLFSLFLTRFQPILAWNEAIKVFFNFFQFYCYFFVIFYYEPGKDEMKWYFLFSLFLSLFLPIYSSNEAKKEFFNFLTFFAIFLEFSIMCFVRTKRNDNFYFLTVSWFSCRFWIEIKPWWHFLIFFNFIAIFL